jgi:molybdopterin-guanine dinucleotide biosynthesis protein A
MPDQTITGAILAGGLARRMSGLDKSRLVIADDVSAGRTIIIRQLAVLQRVAATTLIVTTDADRRARPSRFEDLACPVVTDVIDNAGTLGGIHAAVTHADTDRILVVGGDMPYLNAGLLSALATLAADDKVDGAWVRSRRGPEPLLACYRKHTAPAIAAALTAGERRASALGQLLSLRELGPDALATFGDPDTLTMNVNTPDDYRRVQ